MKNEYGRVREKVNAIFRELVGKRAKALVRFNEPCRKKVGAAFRRRHGANKAACIGFHMTDWNWDAAFIVALQLYPERFSADEVRAGVAMFLIHAPSHIWAARRLTGETLLIDFSKADREYGKKARKRRTKLKTR